MFAALKGLWRVSSRRRRVVLCLGAAAGVAGLALALAGWLARTPPAWWSPAPADPALAEPFENAVVRQLTAPRETDKTFVVVTPGAWRSEPWSVSISEADVNAWLATRLEAWLANRNPGFTWPGGVSTPTVRFEDGLVRVGVVLRDEGGERVLSASFVPRVDEQGALWLDDGDVRIGRLPISTGLASRLHPGSGGVIEAAMHALAGGSPLTARAAVPLEGGRVVRVLSLGARSGRVEVRCRTERLP